MAVLSKGDFWAHGLSLAGPLEKASVKELPSCIAVLNSTTAKRNRLFQMSPPPVARLSLSLCKMGDFQCCEVLPF